MKRTFKKNNIAKKVIVVGMTIAVSVSALAGCKGSGSSDAAKITYNTDSKVVSAFNTVLNNNDYANVLSSSATIIDPSNANSGYEVTVVTESGVEQVTLDSSLNVTDEKTVTPEAGAGESTSADTSVSSSTDASVSTSTSEIAPSEAQPELSLTEKAYAKALELFGVNAEAVVSLDFSEHKYMGQNAIEVEAKTADAKYTIVLNAKTFEVYENKIKLHTTKADNVDESSYITEEKALEIAFATVGATSETATNLKVKSVKDKGAKVYGVKFVYGNYSYNVKINAITGLVIKFEQEVTKESILSSAIETAISAEKAEEIAKAFIGDELNEAVKTKIKLDYEDDMFVYEVEIKNGKTEYEIEIDASTGDILDVEFDDEDRMKPSKPKHDDDDDDDDHKLNGKFITEDEAKTVVLEKVASESAFVADVEIERIKGKFFYEIEVVINDDEVVYLVDAETKEISENVEKDHPEKPEKPEKPDDDDDDEKHRAKLDKKALLMEAIKMANASEKQVKHHSIKYNKEDGTYKVSFSIKDINYSFTFDAESGELIVSDTMLE